MLERFTREARDVVRAAEREARLLGDDRVRAVHLLVAVVDRLPAATLAPPTGPLHLPWHDPRGPVDAPLLRTLLAASDPDAEALATLGISLPDVRRRVEESLGPTAWEGAAPRRLRFAPDARAALEGALREAIELRTRRIGCLEVMLGLLRTDGPAARLLDHAGGDAAELRTRLRATLESVGRLAARRP